MKRKIRWDHVNVLLIILLSLIYSLVLIIGSLLYKPDVVEIKEFIVLPQISIEPKKLPEEELFALLEEKQNEPIYVGTFKLTGYCACTRCCGPNASGITASGTRVTAGRTIAADTSIFPFGTKLIINGNTYVVEDTGSAIKGNKIDIYMPTHESCLSSICNGYAEVYMPRS